MGRTLCLAALLLATGLAHAQPGLSMLGVESASVRVPPEPAAVDPVLARLGDDPAGYGARQGEYDSGFDPKRDAPEFTNFTSAIGPAGDCLGMSFVAQWLYRHASWGGGACADARGQFRRALLAAYALRGVEGRHPMGCFSSYREASKDPGVAEDLRRVIALEQGRNFVPAPTGAFIASLVQIEDWNEARYPRLKARLAAGQPALIAMTRPMTSDGHFVLAYRVVEFEQKSLIFVYDSNAGPVDDCVLVLDRLANRVDYHRSYAARFHYAYANFVVYEALTIRDIVTDPGAVAGSVKAALRDLGASAWDQVRNWVSSAWQRFGPG